MNSICLKPIASLTVHTTSGFVIRDPWQRVKNELFVNFSPCRVQRWYAQSESIIIKTHSKTIDYRFYLLVFFLSLLLFTVPRCKTIVLKDSRIFQDFLLIFLQFLKTIGGVWFYLLVLCVQIKFNQTYYKDMCVLLLPCNPPPPPRSTYAYTHTCNS